MTAARVGVMVPTFNRPDLVRACVLQLAAQSRPPDVICVHQNGHPDSYQWAVADLRPPASEVVWLHTPAQIPQHEWYAVPLRHLIGTGCSHFFWADHDDLYLHDHIAQGLADLQEFDFSVSRQCGLLFTKAADFRYAREVDFTVHAPGGMSSTMCFNRAFAARRHHARHRAPLHGQHGGARDDAEVPLPHVGPEHLRVPRARRLGHLQSVAGEGVRLKQAVYCLGPVTRSPFMWASNSAQ
jgi:hypothetical protein